MQGPTGYYERIRQFLFEELWRADLDTLRPSARWAYGLARFLFVLVREFSNGQLNLRAMSLVYTTLLSMVPLLAVSFSVLKAFGVHKQVEPLLFNLVQPLGEKGQELVVKLLGFVENMQVGLLGSVGLALLIYTVISLIQKVEESFNYAWHASGTRSLPRRFSDYLSVIMVGPVLVFSAIGLTASMMNTSLMHTLAGIEPFGTLLLLGTRLMPFLLILVAFCFLYLFIPNTRVKFSSALVGALVGGAIWQGTGLVFAEFAASSTRYDAIYSSFAILVLFMIWLYLNWLILLIGAQVAYYHQHPEQVRLGGERVPLRGRFREQVALLVMYWVAHRFVHESKPVSLEELTQLLRLPPDRVAEVVELLVERGLLAESATEPTGFLLLHDPAGQTLAEVMAAIRQPDRNYEQLQDRLYSLEAVDTVMERVDTGITEQLGGITLRALVTDNDPLK